MLLYAAIQEPPTGLEVAGFVLLVCSIIVAVIALSVAVKSFWTSRSSLGTAQSSLRNSDRSVQLQEEQAALLPDVMLSKDECDFSGDHPNGCFVLFNIRNIGTTNVTEVRGTVDFDHTYLEPRLHEAIFTWEQWSESTVAYDALRASGMIGVRTGTNTSVVNMFASEIPPDQRRAFKVPVSVHAAGQITLLQRVVCVEGCNFNRPVQITIPDAAVQDDTGD